MLKRCPFRLSLVALMVLSSTSTYAEEIDMSGFDDTPVASVEKDKTSEDSLLDGFTDETPSGRLDDEGTGDISEEKVEFITGLTGKITQFTSYAYSATKPHNNLTSLRTSLLLDYEHKFKNKWRFKINAKTYYDTIYDFRDQSYSEDELNEFQSELRLYDAYIEGSISEDVDFKVGRQVVVWGRSDTIRITDILNPLDNRRPAIVDIEDLRLPIAMAKVDWFVGNWRITPIAILEQHFSLNPPFGSAFNPMPNPDLMEENYNDISYALSVGGEFSGWDINFYATRVRDDVGYVKVTPVPTLTHDKVNMLGTALNVLSGSWLLKAELAYFDGLKYTSTQNETFQRTDALVGVEYKGLADTLISYDISLRHMNHYDPRLLNEINPLEKNTYQHAFRVSSDFMNATLQVNCLISLFGEKLDAGGFQRAWVKYELSDGINMNMGVVDYIGGSPLFDTVQDSDMIFADISYSF